MLYHGTPLGGLKVIKANARSHTSGRRVAYFTEDRCYALVCCRSREENFVTMGPGRDGRQHYFERFPDQLRTLYGGRRGYLYTPESMEGLERGRGHSWESAADVPVGRCQVVEDVFDELLKEERMGNLIVHRYADIDPAEQREQANIIKASKDAAPEEMRRFYEEHFSELWD